MKVKYVVMDAKTDREVKRYDSEEQALAHVEKGPPRDLLGPVEWYIRKVWTNSKDKDK